MVFVMLLVCSVAQGGLVITKVAGPPSGPGVRVAYTLQDSGGTTSLRFFPPREGEPDKDDPAEFIYDSPQSKPRVWYYTRDRDLGQTFTTGSTPFFLDALTLRIGATDTAVRDGALGARIFIQLYQVTGTPVINDHGTTGPDGSGDGKYTRWKTYNPADAKTDDYITGETLVPLAVVEGDLPTTLAKNDWLRFDFTGEDERWLEANRVYAWVIGFVAPAPERSFSLANRFHPNTPADDYTGGHGLRRDGSTLNLEATFVRNLTDEADKEASRQAASFSADLPTRLAQPPGTFGFPDVEGHRDFRFYIEGRRGFSGATTGDGAGADAYISSNAVTNPGTDTRMRVRNDATAVRKSYLRFDLTGQPPLDARAFGATLRLTTPAAASGFPNPLTIQVHGLNDGHAGEDWGETAITYASAPAHSGSNAVETSAAPPLGSFTIAGGSVFAGQALALDSSVLGGLLAFLRADTNRRVTFILQSPAALGNSLDFSTKENPTYGGAELTYHVLSAGLPQNVTLPASASLAGRINDVGQLPDGVSVAWSKVSGPGAVSFSAPNALATSAAFGLPGSYVLRLTASYGADSGSDEVAVVVADSYAAWAARVFPPGTPPAEMQPGADPEGDGLANRLEYALALSPLGASAPPVLGTIALGADAFLTLSYRQRRGGVGLPGIDYRADGITYTVEFATRLDPANWQHGPGLVALAGPPAGNGDGTETVTVRALAPLRADSQQYLRLAVTE